jgi:hypothetical protein
MKTEENNLKKLLSCCKDRVSARITENGAKMEKLGLKQDSRDLSAINLNLKGLWLKKPRARLEINPRQRG